MTTREEMDRRDRRDLDKRFEKVDSDIKNVASVHAEEMSAMEGRASASAAWQASHDAKDEERWKGNGEKWVAADKRFDGMDTKLNAIIGTSLMTLLAVCGFFIANFVEHQQDKKSASIDTTTFQARQQDNQ